jgi:L-phenylalanine/L-methionine N-acetyltransferase
MSSISSMAAGEIRMASAPFRGDDLTFRSREAQDDCGLLELFSEERFLHDASAREPFASCEDMRIWLDGIGAAQEFEIVGVLQGKIVGFGALYILGDGQSHSGWIMLGVREELHRRGIGSILMRMLVATAHVFVGLQRLQLTVYSDNEVAIRLYEKFGFEIEGFHRRFARRGTDFVDAFTMARIFDEAEAVAPTAEGLRRSRFACASWSGDHEGRWIAA